MEKEKITTIGCLKRVEILINTRKSLAEELLTVGYQNTNLLNEAYAALDKMFIEIIIQEIKALETSLR